MSPAHVIIVDDEDAIVQMVTRGLAAHGYTTDSYADARSFREAPVFPATSIVLLDLQLGQANGIDLLRFLAERRCKSPIIVISGVDANVVATAERLGRAYGLNIAGRLQKPFGLADLAGMVNAVATAKGMGPSRKLTEEEELHRAVIANELTLFYQPKVALASGDLVGWEALVRWQHPERGLLPPVAFIPLAEETGLITPLTYWVIDEAIRQLSVWRAAGICVPIAVNVSPGMLEDLTLPDTIARLLEMNDVPGTMLTIEVTEGGATRDIVTAMDVLARLRLMDIALSVDDFGTGHSSLAKLRQLPFNELKIDRSFIRDIIVDQDARAITEAAIAMTRRLGIAAVAEGVETSDIAEELVAMGCGKAQGFFFARPMPVPQCEEWIRSEGWRPRGSLAVAV